MGAVCCGRAEQLRPTLPVEVDTISHGPVVVAVADGRVTVGVYELTPAGALDASIMVNHTGMVGDYQLTSDAARLMRLALVTGSLTVVSARLVNA